jgi:glycosyltransferase involved in cell wall biosynthesis
MHTSNDHPHEPRLLMITPVHNEASFIGPMIDSVVGQAFQPAKWLIIDDGSSDCTPDIVARHAITSPFIELLRLPRREERQAGGEGAIAHALKLCHVEDFEYVGRFDGDLILGRDYIAGILKEFDQDPQLGIAGGGLYIYKKDRLELERAPEYHVRGAVKMYRRQCLECIGGLSPGIGWDTIDEVYAWLNGWKTKSFFQYKVIHSRPTGSCLCTRDIYRERGKAEYLTWSHPMFVLAKTVKLFRDELSLVASVSFLMGFVNCYFTRKPRITDSRFVAARRGQQLRRIALSFISRGQSLHRSYDFASRLQSEPPAPAALPQP